MSDTQKKLREKITAAHKRAIVTEALARLARQIIGRTEVHNVSKK